MLTVERTTIKKTACTVETHNVTFLSVEGELSTREVADLLGVCRQTVARMVRRGVLTPTRKVGQSFMFRRDDIEAKAA